MSCNKLFYKVLNGKLGLIGSVLFSSLVTLRLVNSKKKLKISIRMKLLGWNYWGVKILRGKCCAVILGWKRCLSLHRKTGHRKTGLR